MDLLPLMDVISVILFLILYVIFFWRVSKLQPPREFFLLDFVCYKPPFSKPDPTQVLEARPALYPSPIEVENVVFEMVDDLLKKTKEKVKNIRVLVCVFNGSSSVSLTSMIAKRYKLNEDIASYDLNGKGCNSGLMAITLAKQLLQAKHDCCALVLTTEELPEIRHVSTDPEIESFLPEYHPSGATILLSNRTSDSLSPKYKLIGTHNVHVALSDNATSASNSQVAVTVSDDALSASEKVLRSNVDFVSTLLWPAGPEQGRRFSLCQVGGAPMVGAVERNPKIPKENLEVSRMFREWFGYEPVSGLWYKLGFLEAGTRNLEKGVWVSQMGMWSDWSEFKGTTLVWRAMGAVDLGERKTRPMIFKVLGDVNVKRFFVK